MSIIRLAGHRPQVAGIQFIDEISAPPSVGDPGLCRIGLQVFLQDSTGTLWPLIPGADSAGVVTVTAAMSPYALQPSDRYLLVDTTGGPVQVTLPAAGGVSVNPVQVVDAKRNFGVNALTINGSGHNINAAATLVISLQDACPVLFWGGTTWEVNPTAVVVPFNPHVPGPIGDTTPSTGAFTVLTATSIPVAGPIGGTTPNTGAFTTVTATTTNSQTVQSAAGSWPMILSGSPANTYGATALWVKPATALTTAGTAAIEVSNGVAQGTVGNRFYGAVSGGQSDALCDGMTLNASGTINDGDVCIWSSTKLTVVQSPASAANTGLAGVAVGSGSGGKVKVAMSGLAYVNSVAAVGGSGTMLGTSGATAGKVDSLLSTNVGTLLGRSLEAVGATVAGKILCQLALG